MSLKARPWNISRKAARTNLRWPLILEIEVVMHIRCRYWNITDSVLGGEMEDDSLHTIG